MKTRTAQPGDPVAPASATVSPLVLVVDDFEDNREMYAQFLRFSGYRVEEAATGREALERAFTMRPDVIIMDLSLPGVDGWEATRRIKADERTKSIPVIALTGHALAGHSKGAFEAGCDAFVTKPCLPEDLMGEIERLLAGTRSKVRTRTGRPRHADRAQDRVEG